MSQEEEIEMATADIIEDDEELEEAAHEEPPFRLEAGRRYVARNGWVTSPLVELSPDKKQPFAGCFAETGDGIWTWQPDGETWSGPEWWLVAEAK
jgi:hypothetical protein